MQIWIVVLLPMRMTQQGKKQPFRGVLGKGVLGKGVQKKCNKFTGEHPCRSAISIKLQSNFIEMALWHGCSPLNLLHIFRTSFPKNTSGGLSLKGVFNLTF